jgi:hypothetical protein
MPDTIRAFHWHVGMFTSPADAIRLVSLTDVASVHTASGRRFIGEDA